jgi:hypothetical protein
MATSSVARRAHNFKNEIGNVYGRLTVLARAETVGNMLTWRCRCSCGNETVAYGSNLRRGHSRSCGCLKIEVTLTRCTTHGEARHGKLTPEYRAWAALINRCENPQNPRFKDYGGRGITVCERWRSSYETFLADMGRRPSPRHSLDRIDNNGHYEPANCRWATASEQRRNQRRMITSDAPVCLDISSPHGPNPGHASLEQPPSQVR